MGFGVYAHVQLISRLILFSSHPLGNLFTERLGSVNHLLWGFSVGERTFKATTLGLFTPIVRHNPP